MRCGKASTKDWVPGDRPAGPAVRRGAEALQGWDDPIAREGFADPALAALSAIERHVQDMETALLDRALLSANPPRGDAAEGSSPSDGPDDFCEHGYTTEDSAHPSAGLERCPTCSPSDGGGAK